MTNQFSIHDCEAMAKKEGYDKATFDLVGATGRIKCKWLDAYFGMFTMEGTPGFMTVNQVVEWGGLHCENFNVEGN